MQENEAVIIQDLNALYPDKGIFAPDEFYPEYLFKDKIKINNKNSVYRLVREAFHLAGYDAENYGLANWNPLKKFIKPGDVVLIKPNMVREKNFLDVGEECVYTQPSVAAPVIDYALKALNNSGKIIIADSPVQECDFEKFIETSGYKDLINFYANLNIKIELKDLREFHSSYKDGLHYYVKNDAQGIDVNLNQDSLFANNKNHKNLRVTNYDPHILNKFHNSKNHVYKISDYALNADVIINMPKPKSHGKAGLTISLKNLIGVIARKECIPHHTNGSPAHGGDEYESPTVFGFINNKLLDCLNYLTQTANNYKLAEIIKFLSRVNNKLSRIFKSRAKLVYGSWHGNNTICKSIIDINKCVLYADKQGNLQNTKQRKYLIVADMIISGEHNGSLSPEPKHNGMIAIGENPAAFDCVMSKLMGIKPEYFRTLKYAQARYEKYNLTPENNLPVRVISNCEKYNNKTVHEISDKDLLYFKPHDGWEEAFLQKN